ncbi:MAG: ankyrin repeat domain-containing protein [Treponema sp.]|nr:ankyrin repeat domain-containing protein [Treponema sp.]
MGIAIGIIILIIVLYNLYSRYGFRSIVLLALSIAGLFCGRALVLGETDFPFWFFALVGEIVCLCLIEYFIGCSRLDLDSKLLQIMTVVGTVVWGIALKLVFWDKTLEFGLFLFICIFIAPYFIVASLDVLFYDSTVLMVFIGIAKVLSSILLYLGDLIGFLYNARIYNKISWTLIAYFVIVSSLALLSFILIILKPAVCAIGNRKEQLRKQKQIKKESKRKQTKEKYSYQLITAVEKSDIKTVISLLEKGADVNYKDFSGKIPLKIAIKNNDKNIISLLLERGANIEYKDRYGCTPLLNAVENGNVDMASFLLDKGANINCCDSRSRTALDLAIEKEDVELISFLLERGADIGDSESSLKAALDFAIKNDNADILSFLAEQAVHKDVYIEDKPFLFFAMENDYKKLVELLIEKGANIECRGKYENTPLLIAAHDGNLALVSLLVEHGANIECENEDKFTPLSAAAAKGSLDTVSFLLEKGANVEHEDKNGSTPLEYAAIVGKNKEIVSLLIEHGANIEHKDKNGVTPLDRAINGENKEFISILLEKGANVNYISKIDDTETTPLLSAITGRNEEIVSLLLEKGADVNLATANGFTVLQQAICDRNKNIVSILLDAGADVNKNSDKIETSLIDAVDKENYDPEIVSLLIESGADVNLESAFHGHTPLISAVSQNNKDAVLLLLKNGADPNKKSSKLGSPLMIAFQAVNKEMCALLMENDANPSEVLCVAAMMQNTEVAQFFLERGADVNCRGIGDKTPLMHAISFSTKEMVLFLISNGADVNLEMSEPSEKNSPRTPLEAAIVSGKAEMLSLLITYGADVNYETKNGNTPLLFAALHKQIKLVPILKEAGAVSVVSAKSVQSSVKMSKATADSQNDATDFNAALVSLSKIIAKNSAEILSSENNQKLKALVSDLIPQENEIASKLKQAFSCDFTQIILDSDGKSDSKKEKAFKDAVDKIITKTKLKKNIAISIVRLVALSLGWHLENLNME